MNTETQKLQEEINSMGLVELLDTISKVSKTSDLDVCPAIYTLLNNRLKELDKQAFFLIRDSHSPDLSATDVGMPATTRNQDVAR